MTPRPLLHVEWRVHKLLFSLTGGRIGTAPPRGGVGTLFLLSTGRRTGKRRRNGLFYIEDGPNFVVVASNAGENVDPQWWKNVQANPDVEVELGMRRIAVRARAATPEEAERLWPRLEAAYPDFVEYRAQVHGRRIPVIILEPRESPSAGAESG